VVSYDLERLYGLRWRSAVEVMDTVSHGEVVSYRFEIDL
jgi:hypothetical protein